MGSKLTCEAVSTGVAPPTPTDLLSVRTAGIVPTAAVSGATVRGTVAAVIVGVALHSETQLDSDSISVGIAIEVVPVGPGRAYTKVILSVDVIHFVVISTIFIPDLDVKLETSLHKRKK